jgi:outer membrane protein OmpA-like peptidoglycan-associated protein
VASISATVTAPLSDGGAAITNYRLSCSPDCGGTHDSATAGVVALTGLTPGTSYSVSVIAQNSVGDSAATTKAATPNAVVVPLATVTPSTTKLVITTGGTFKAVCRYNVALVKTCAVTAKSATGVVLATGKAVTVPAGATAVSETLTLTAAGITAAKAAGGVAVILTATVTPVAGSALVAKGSLVVVNKSIKVTLLGNVLFGSNSAVLSPAGKAALIKVAKQIQGAKQLECDGHTAKTGNPAGELKLGLQRATVACSFIKAEITLLKLKPIGKYVVKSYGATRPVSKNQALNRRVEFIVSN